MNKYFITYNDEKTVTITDISAEQARATLKKVITGVFKINATVKIRKDGQLSKVRVTKNKNPKTST